MDAVNTAIPVWQARQRSISPAGAIEGLMVEKQRERRSVRYIQDIRHRLSIFAKAFEGRTMAEISAIEVRDWLRKLPVTHISQNNMRRLLSVLFSFAVANEWCAENVVLKIKPAITTLEKIGILTPKEAAQLLLSADKEFTAHIAIGLFCGLRRSELERLTPKSIRDSGLVEVDVRKTRGNARRFVKIRPNLKAWLDSFPVQSLTTKQFRTLLDNSIEAAGLKWPKNALRHSFCSYALAHEKNLNELVLEMGHTNPHTLFAHYRELVTPADAETYWSITPKTAPEIAQPQPTAS